MPAKDEGPGIVARNRKARHEYEILETLEAGMVLTGTEVKSLRAGKANLVDAYARIERGEAWLHNLHISPYEAGTAWNHDPVRRRKLLLHKQQIRKLVGTVEQQGLTMVPLDLHFLNGVAKVTLAVVRGKKLHDKRQDLKERETAREVERALRTR